MAAKRPPGRPSTFKPEYIEQVERLAMLGFTNKELAEYFGLASDDSALDTWTKRHPEFASALKRGRVEADCKVAAALFKRATGFNYTEEQAVGGKGGADVVTVERYQIPDVGAICFWLKNRHRNAWRDKPPEEAVDGGAMERALRALAERLPD